MINRANAALAAAYLLASAHAAPSHVMDQAVRQLAAEFASQQLGMNPFHATQGAMASVCAALKVVDPGLCGTTAAAASPAPAAKPPAVGGGPVFYVSPGGNDSAAGTLAAPFATLSRAQLATRQAAKTAKASTPATTTTPPATVYLLPGRYELGAAAGPLVLTPEDSGTTWASAPGAPSGSAVLSGGVDLGAALAWTPVKLKNGHAALRAKLPAAAAQALALGPGMRSLMVDGRRQVRHFTSTFSYFYCLLTTHCSTRCCPYFSTCYMTDGGWSAAGVGALAQRQSGEGLLPEGIRHGRLGRQGGAGRDDAPQPHDARGTRRRRHAHEGRRRRQRRLRLVHVCHGRGGAPVGGPTVGSSSISSSSSGSSSSSSGADQQQLQLQLL